MDADKIALCWPNRIDEATLSVDAPGAWSTSHPLALVQNGVFQKQARSDGLSDVNLIATFPRSRSIGVIGLPANNLSVTATWRVRGWYDDALTDEVLDSGFMDVWPASIPPEDLEWEDDNWWDGRPSDEERALYTPLAVYFIDPAPTCRAIRIDIVDDDNPDGYIALGRVFVAPAWQPDVNISYGGEYGHQIDTTVSKVEDTEYFDPLTPRRRFVMPLQHLDETEAFQKIFRMQRELGIHGELLVAADLNPGPLFLSRTFIGRLVNADPLRNPYLENYSTSLQVMEKL